MQTTPPLLPASNPFADLLRDDLYPLTLAGLDRVLDGLAIEDERAEWDAANVGERFEVE